MNEINIPRDIRIAFELELTKEIPKLTTMDRRLASDYFTAGYKAAIERNKIKEKVND
jgi:hypothetical protein